jgi:predicted peptidase
MKAILPASLLLAGCMSTAVPQTGFLDRTIDVGGRTRRYQIFVPRDYDAARRWPAILFLHGAGERGDDGIFPTAIALGNAIRRRPDLYPAIVIFPQTPKGSSWNEEMERAATSMLDATMRELSVDPDRIALTGISMGGAGTWRLALSDSRRFRAIAPVCGWIVPPASLPEFAEDLASREIDASDPYGSVAARLARSRIWITHGAKDTTVPVSESRAMQQALERAGADVRYSEFPEAGHNAWDPSYLDPAFARFLTE